jgi:hypothetical protein
MRFNNKRSCLDFFETGIPNNLYIHKESWPQERKSDFIKNLQKGFNSLKPLFQKKVQYITHSFYDAYDKNRKKTFEALQSEPLTGEYSGTFILQPTDGVVKTIFYFFHHESFDYFNCAYMSFTKYKDITALDAVITYRIDGSNEWLDFKTVLGDPYKKHGIEHGDVIAEFVLMKSFLRYCDIETKVIAPKEKYRKMGVKYFNETKQNIEILDSTWFTNIVRTEGFHVRGHLRLQPYGPGMAYKKWIYIDDFEKHGYVRKAKKEI